MAASAQRRLTTGEGVTDCSTESAPRIDREWSESQAAGRSRNLGRSSVQSVVCRAVVLEPKARLRTGVEPEVHCGARRTLDCPGRPALPPAQAPEPARGSIYVDPTSRARRSCAAKLIDGLRLVRSHIPWIRPPFRRT